MTQFQVAMDKSSGIPVLAVYRLVNRGPLVHSQEMARVPDGDIAVIGAAFELITGTSMERGTPAEFAEATSPDQVQSLVWEFVYGDSGSADVADGVTELVMNQFRQKLDDEQPSTPLLIGQYL